MKKSIAIISVLMMLASFTACGSKSDKKTEKTTAEASEAVATGKNGLALDRQDTIQNGDGYDVNTYKNGLLVKQVCYNNKKEITMILENEYNDDGDNTKVVVTDGEGNLQNIQEMTYYSAGKIKTGSLYTYYETTTDDVNLYVKHIMTEYDLDGNEISCVSETNTSAPSSSVTAS